MMGKVPIKYYYITLIFPVCVPDVHQSEKNITCVCI